MSFACYARKVLDTSLPLNHSVQALKGCLETHRPIGFCASFSFLQFTAGDFAEDPSALPRALELLTASRAAWQADVRAYGVLRRTARGSPPRRVVLVLAGCLQRRRRALPCRGAA